MRAAVLEDFGAALEVRDVDEPTPAQGELLVRVHAVGLCGTDLKIAGGALDGTPLPLVMGHEIAGTVAQDPSGALAEGTRVACYFYDPCEQCGACRAGALTICPNSRRLGFERDGGLAEFVRLKAVNALPLADAVSFEHAAVTMDAIASPWRALITRAQLHEGETLAVIGAGGLGLHGTQIACHVGADVAAIDPSEGHRQEALRHGAALAVAPSESAAVLDWSDGGVDVVLETSGKRAGFEAGLACLRDGGRVVCCGYDPGREYGVDSMRLVLAEIAVLGSRASTREEASDALAAVASGTVRPIIAGGIGLEAVNDGLDRVRRGDVLGRIVVDPWS